MPWRVPWACSTSMRTTLSRTSSRSEMPAACAACSAPGKKKGRRENRSQPPAPRAKIDPTSQTSGKYQTQIAKLTGVQQARDARNTGLANGSFGPVFTMRCPGMASRRRAASFACPSFGRIVAPAPGDGMRFFRRRSSPGLIALLALAMQAALLGAYARAFACAHGRLLPVRSKRRRPRLGQERRASPAARWFVSGCAPAVPHDHRNDCPMCWSVATAGTGVLPAATHVALDAPRFAMLAPLRGRRGP